MWPAIGRDRGAFPQKPPIPRPFIRAVVILISPRSRHATNRSISFERWRAPPHRQRPQGPSAAPISAGPSGGLLKRHSRPGLFKKDEMRALWAHSLMHFAPSSEASHVHAYPKAQCRAFLPFHGIPYGAPPALIQTFPRSWPTGFATLYRNDQFRKLYLHCRAVAVLSVLNEEHH